MGRYRVKKYASMVILSASLAPTGKQALRTFAHRHAFTYEPRPGYLYVRSRAISSRCNDNYDEFPAEEIKKAYSTFVGKPVFVNHHNDNHRRARGVIIDAALHEDTNPDGSPDTWAEVLMEVDANKFPKLAKAILAGHVDRTSMGTDVAFSKCSVCNNKATNPTEYCQHIPKMKGQRIYRTTASGKKEGVLVREKCYGLGFFENSLLVEEPADPTAYFLGVDDHSGMTRSATKAPPSQSSDSGQHSGMESDSCTTCGKDIYKVQNSAAGGWQHDIDGAAGVPHQAFPKTAARGPGFNAMDPMHKHLVEDHAIDPHLLSKRPANYLHQLHHETVHTEMPGSMDGVLNTNTMEGHSVPMHSNKFHVHEEGYDSHKMMSFSSKEFPASDFHKAEDGKKCSRWGCDKPAVSSRSVGGKQLGACSEHKKEMTKDALIWKSAYGETMAPQDVDTLRDEECPVCGESDSYDGNECQVCGFITPPKMFLDPDVDMAKNLDLRKDVAEAQNPGEDLNGDGMPDSIPGSTQPGSDATGEVDPTMLDENGQPVDPQTGEGLTDDASDTSVDPQTGLPIEQEGDDLDPSQIDPETGLPVEQNEDVDPNAMNPDGQPDEMLAGDPGRAGDGAPDLMCPQCGYEVDSTQPVSVNTADPAGIPAGAANGDVCPNCQGALLTSIADEQQAGAIPAAPVR